MPEDLGYYPKVSRPKIGQTSWSQGIKNILCEMFSCSEKADYYPVNKLNGKGSEVSQISDINVKNLS